MAKRHEFIKNGFRYFIRNNRYGYGSEIIQTPEGKYKYVYMFNSLDKEQVIYQFSCMENASHPEDFKFPVVSDEKDMKKVLKIKAKHYIYHYSVPTLELFHKAIKQFLTSECGNYIDSYKPQKPENNTGIGKREDSDLIPFKELRIDVEDKWEAYEKELRSYENDLGEWQNIKTVITTETDGNVVDAINHHCGEDTWELINLEIVE